MAARRGTRTRSGKLSELSVRAVLTIPDVLGELRIDGEIGLAEPASGRSEP